MPSCHAGMTFISMPLPRCCNERERIMTQVSYLSIGIWKLNMTIWKKYYSFLMAFCWINQNYKIRILNDFILFPRTCAHFRIIKKFKTRSFRVEILSRNFLSCVALDVEREWIIDGTKIEEKLRRTTMENNNEMKWNKSKRCFSVACLSGSKSTES